MGRKAHGISNKKVLPSLFSRCCATPENASSLSCSKDRSLFVNSRTSQAYNEKPQMGLVCSRIGRACILSNPGRRLRSLPNPHKNTYDRNEVTPEHPKRTRAFSTGVPLDISRHGRTRKTPLSNRKYVAC